MYIPILGLIFTGLVGLAHAIESRSGQGCAYFSQTREIYCMGGNPFSSASNDMPVYSLNVNENSMMDLQTAEWQIIEKSADDVAPQAASNFLFSSTGDNDTLYVEGGKVCPGCHPNYGYIFSISTKEWKQVNNYKPTLLTTALYASGSIWSFGGKTTSDIGLVQDITMLYNVAVRINTTTWVHNQFTDKRSKYPQATWSASMVYAPLDHMLVIIGGYEYLEGSVLVKMDDIITIDIKNQKYSKFKDTSYIGSSLPLSRQGHSTVMDPSNENIVMFGGCDDNKNGMNDLWLYNIKDKSWEQKNTSGVAPTPRCWHSVESYMLVLFGEQNGVSSDEIGVALDMTTWTWTSQPVFGSPPVTEKLSIEEATTAPSTAGSSGLSTKVITGIIVCVICVVLIISGFIVFYCVRRRNDSRRRQKFSQLSDENTAEALEKYKI
ncbi:hypothetical protein CLU79DRAFT_32987 [Phycomyces nitens]|nr:hypothetical protein CLU79DRAFT_32987 [Phycomyces nitens]